MAKGDRTIKVFVTRHRSKAMMSIKRAIIGIMINDGMIIIKDDGYKIE